jgi:SP family myo-inositol transporter-like MFS transporter 13
LRLAFRSERLAGLGPVPWAVNSEIHALPVRGFANGLAATVNWLVNFAVSISFLTLLRWMTELGTFLFYAGICGLAWVFVFVCLPETKQKSLEQIRAVFEQPFAMRCSCCK